MATVPLTPALAAEYASLFDACTVQPRHAAQVTAAVRGLLQHRDRYAALGSDLGIPWHFPAILHTMECSGRFDRHLHNGDPLTARTSRVPSGRPGQGQPPFTWEQSAADALAMKKLGPGTDWSLPGTLYQFERYNGFGYRLQHGIHSPYLWSFSNHYTGGKYVADGTWSATAVSKQCGAAVLLKELMARGEA
ncbi:peptidoglycan-binding protein [Desulfovibrio sulfodismutans]|uniref:Peptidoglycan-binding protein n=2 Tax=Desulfolutivibrio sulfodismutans TaxID=63561 RepID=A0A7K3NR33_9BACT|nr:peptidoglycan-binding protein [Desulfolutivibrio sulfodismutans]QLA12438.1 peptidoglycan-binding protein [Desulfolutivibrio sulfodismutans DSM 3696]